MIQKNLLISIILFASVCSAQTPKASEVVPDWPKNPPEHWVRYHLAHPDPKPGFFSGDPNAALYYKGKYHLHYLYPGTGGRSMAHVSSDDMVHWKWHKTTLGPQGGHMLSGTAFLTKEGKPAIIYSNSHKIMIVYGLDDNLDSWTEPEKVVVKTKGGSVKQVGVWDPDCWLNGDTYYITSSGDKRSDLMKSTDLKNWEYLGDLMHPEFPNNFGVTPNDDLSCPNMFKIADKWMLLNISHTLGCRYFIGDFKDEKFLPESHGLMNWQNINYGKRGLGFFFVPESLLTPDGRRVMYAWLFPDKQTQTQQGLQSLPRELELVKDGTLRVRPLRELQTLRGEMKSESDIVLQNLEPYQLKEMSGDALEFEVVFKPLNETYKLNRPHVLHVPRSFGMNVLCDDEGNGGVQIAICPSNKTLRINDIIAPLEVEIDKEIVLRVFIDNTVIEVFANDRQAIAYSHTKKHPHANNYLFAEQGSMPVKKVTAWKMNSIYTKAAAGLK